MTEVNYNGKEELLMTDYEGISDSDLTSKYANTDFDITDAPSTYITNANFTFLIFFHKTPLSKGRLDYQSPFPFCKAATTLHYPYGIVNFAVTLNSKIPPELSSEGLEHRR